MGTTMVRVMELAEKAVEDGLLSRVCFGDIYRKDIMAAKEILIVGTTTNVTRVKEFDGEPVGSPDSHPVYDILSRLLREDIASNPDLRTPVFEPENGS
jgi:branched-chain amino acid aminotransferase